MQGFHPITRQWFLQKFKTATPPQRRGWPSLQENQNTLIAAPTGSGKTMAAFLVAIDRLLTQALAGELEDKLQIVYISPLRALSNDVKKNLDEPLKEIQDLVQEQYGRKISIKVGLRTGDSTPTERSRLLRQPPQILVTTPESLYLLLTSQKGRSLLKPVNTLIIDEIHALARDKRGSHLSLSIERLEHLVAQPLTRIGLSATMKPLSDIAKFLCASAPCTIIDEKSHRPLDLAVQLPSTPLSAVCSHQQWQEVFANLAKQIQAHRSSLVFVNTRRMAERVTFHLSEILGDEAVTSHHGSLSKEARFKAESRLKSGELKAVVATASLELGIDVGYIDLVCQIGSPRAISTFMQRIGRSGHALGLTPKGRLFALTRDELIECYALIRACHAKDMDAIEIPKAPLDILAQQIVAMCSAEDWSTKDLYQLVTRSWVYQDLSSKDFHQVIQLLTHGISERSRKGAYLHHDQVNGVIKGRRNARLSALTSGGAIPEQNLYRVVTAESETFIGTLDEDFAIESSRGDIFLLGNTSWQVEAVRDGKVIVHDAGGAPPTIPFWFGEAPGRTFELSRHVSQLRETLAECIDVSDPDDPDWNLESPQLPRGNEAAAGLISKECLGDHWGCKQAIVYIGSQKLATTMIPSQEKILFERFFDETGGMQLVIHAPFGSRINRAWGLAFRKRFCRGFDFELQASADDNGIVLSVGPNQSFAIEALFGMLNHGNCRHLLIQALLDVPMFQIRWRWNITRALAILRFKSGKKVAPHLQRYQSDDLLTAVFPQQTQCFEHRTGDLEVPDHPYVQQTVQDCLTEAMDIQGFETLMAKKDGGDIEFVGIDTREPSPFSYELINANPYSFLDDAPLEERRTRAVMTRRTLDPRDFKNLSSLSPDAIAQVRREAWPLVRNADELHEALFQLVVMPLHDMGHWQVYVKPLLDEHRIVLFKHEGQDYYCCSENLSYIRAIYKPSQSLAWDRLPPQLKTPKTWDESIKSLIKGHLEVRGPITAEDLSNIIGVNVHHIDATLGAVEAEGNILSGSFSQDAHPNTKEWCDRRLLSRIHKLTIEGLREQVRPVGLDVFMKFLIAHQHADPHQRLEGEAGLVRVIQLLMGFETPCAAWEDELLSLRLKNYRPQDLDSLCFNGTIIWGRLKPPPRKDDQKGRTGLVSRTMPISLFPRPHLAWLLPLDRRRYVHHLSHNGTEVFQEIQKQGAPFFDDLKGQLRLPDAAIEEALGELISLGLASADGFSAIRPLITPERKRKPDLRRRGRRQMLFETGFQGGGRWSLFPPVAAELDSQDRLENWTWLLLERYGIIFKDLLQRERLAPQWRDLLGILRRLEMRGEIRGGRFIKDTSGEQYALPEAVTSLRGFKTKQSHWLVLSACDPLNLAGILNQHPKIAATPGNRLVYENGELIAYRESGEIHFLQDMGHEKQEILKRGMRLNGSFRNKDPFIREFLQKDPQKFKEKNPHLSWKDIIKRTNQS